MLEINFYPDNNDPLLAIAVEQYKNIWVTESERIVQVLEKITGFKFVEDLINAIVFEGKSHSHPLSLRASYLLETKKATLVHELTHRLLSGNGLKSKETGPDELQVHKALDLILYDTWVELWGEDFAKKQVAIESSRQPFYKDAWNGALSLTKEERVNKFKELVKH